MAKTLEINTTTNSMNKIYKIIITNFLVVFTIMILSAQDSSVKYYNRILIKLEETQELSIDKKVFLTTDDFPKDIGNLLRSAEAMEIQNFDTSRSESSITKNTYMVTFGNHIDIEILADELAKNPDIKYAEPDYIFKAQEIPNDALLGDQWHLEEVQAFEAWDISTGQDQIIAILDTGVDAEHNDLSPNIIEGYDFVNNDSDPSDDNLHGTHVAGIAAAVTNNNIGIAGIARDAKIMPVKVLQSNGEGATSDIVKGIEYAVSNGATVINMSLGSSVESFILKEALQEAYNSCFLVASAGNDGLGMLQETMPSIANFPACYPFVMGVEAVQKVSGNISNSSFSNFDPTGPIEYTNPWGFNYEIKAPGSNIVSTIPNGGYRQVNGTSMAAPIVSGAVALLKSYDNTLSNEDIFSRIIQTADNGLLQIKEALTNQLVPDLHFQSYNLIDTLEFEPGDGDLIADAGETVGISILMKNAGGSATDVKVKMEIAEFEDGSLVDFITDEVGVGDISSYGSIAHPLNPIVLKLSSNIQHNRKIRLKYILSTANGSQNTEGEIVLTVSNREELRGLLTDEMTLDPAREWVVNSSFKVTSSGILNIPPGTNLQLEKKIVNEGIINGLGESENRILISGPKGIQGEGGVMNFKYTDFTNLIVDSEFMYQGDSLYFDYCRFENVIRVISPPNSTNFFDFFVARITNSHFANFSIEGGFGIIAMLNANFDFVNQEPGSFFLDRNNFENISGCILQSSSIYPTCDACFFTNNNISTMSGDIWLDGTSFFQSKHLSNIDFFGNNLVSGNSEKSYFLLSTSSESDSDIIEMRGNYWGTANSQKIESYVYDFWDDADLPLVEFEPYLESANEDAPGVVWKVELNDVDPQDEFLNPIGSESVKFDVYFNRAMDVSVSPFLTFGLVEPWTQHHVTENASWNADSTIWTAYRDIDYRTGDGLNTIRVSTAVDNDGLEIPLENNRRFQFVIQSNSTQATSLNATSDFARIKLDWNLIDNIDVLGYNLYRFTRHVENQNVIFSDTIRINAALILDNRFDDFNVVSDSTYFYMTTYLNSNFSESDFSNAVDATPLEQAVDSDSDGYTSDEDCDDNNPNINPGETEIPYNGLNDDCNTETLDDDLDQDGFSLEDDCDDNNPDVNPNAVEIPNNGIDEDCNGMDLISSVYEIGNSTVNIFPNPAVDEINLDISGELSFQANLFDISGRLVLSQKNVRRLKVYTVPHGTYFLEVKDLKTGQKVVEKILIGE